LTWKQKELIEDLIDAHEGIGKGSSDDEIQQNNVIKVV